MSKEYLLLSIPLGSLVGVIVGLLLSVQYNNLKFECEFGTGGGAKLTVGKGIYCDSGDKLAYRMLPYKSTPERDQVFKDFRKLVGPPGIDSVTR